MRPARRAACGGRSLYWDRVQDLLWLRGQGPHRLADRPVLRRLLEVLTRSSGFSRPADRLFEAVWGGRYDPIVHQTKLHVTVHRLRAWLDERTAGGERLVEVREGVVGLARDADVRVVEAPGVDVSPADLRERLRQCLAESLSPADLERVLGASRSSLHQAVRALLRTGAIVRSGRGRALRYRLTRPSTMLVSTA